LVIHFNLQAMDSKKELIKVLIQNELVDTAQMDEAIKMSEQSGKNFEDLLVSKKVIDPEKLAAIKAKVYGMPYEYLQEKVINEKALNVISSEVAENYSIVCFDVEEGNLKVGITDPDNFQAIEAMDFLAKENGFRVLYFLISRQSFKSAFKQYKTLDKELSTALQKRAEEEEEKKTIKSDKEHEETEEITKSAPVTKIVSVIIRHAVEGGASDIHIEPMQKESRVRYRIDGILHTSLVLPRSIHEALVARIKVMANLKLDESRIPQDGRIRLDINDKNIDFRVSILPLVGSEKVVMRILDTTLGAPKLDDLGYQGVQFKAIQEGIKSTEGVILVTGPTGSGKSTTLFSVLGLLNKEGVNISTLEDPVEYQMKGVNQSQIKPEIGYTFASGLRSFLRQDPDIIMVGEIRDSETAELSVHAALTGHLVLSTLHTMNAAGAITRLVDMGIEPFLLGSTLTTCIAQRLTRKICGHCKKEAEVPAEFLEEMKNDLKGISEDYIKELYPGFDKDNIKIYKGAGCPRCGNSGYSGRVAIVETIDMNTDLKKVIIEGKKNLTLEEIRANQSFVTMKQDGILKVIQGFTTMEEVLRVMKD
jgi:type IV pilus assembly protein PilB